MSVSNTSSGATELLKVKKSPNNRTYAEVRSREHLLPNEVEAMIKAAKSHGRHGYRDSTLILLCYRHGLRVSELVPLKWDQVDLKQACIHVNRLKQGVSSTHPLYGTELRALRQLKRDYSAAYLFISERGGPMSASAAREVIMKAGKLASLPFPVHPHQLRHGCGYYLAAKGVDTRAIAAYLRHRNLQNTMRYTELAPNRFKGFWDG